MDGQNITIHSIIEDYSRNKNAIQENIPFTTSFKKKMIYIQLIYLIGKETIKYMWII